MRDEIERLRVISALRFVPAALLAVLFTTFTGSTSGTFAIVPPMVLILFLRDESLGAGFACIGGMVAAAILGLVTSHLFLQDQPLYLASNLILVFGFGYWAAQAIRGRWPYLPMPLFALLALLSAVFSSLVEGGSARDTAIDWLAEGILGVLACWLVLIVAWPAPSARAFDRLLTSIATECASLLRTTAASVAESRAVSYLPSPMNLFYYGKLLHQIEGNKGRLHRTSPDYTEISRRAHLLGRIYLNTRCLYRALESMPEPGPIPSIREALVEIIEDLAKRLDGGDQGSVTAAIEAVEQRSRDLLDRPEDPPFGERMSSSLSAFLTTAKQLDAEIDELFSPDPAHASPPIPAVVASHMPFFEPDSLKAAIKLTLGIFIAVVAFVLTDIPTNAYLVMIIVIVLVQPNLGRAHLRFRLWFPGVAIGTVYGLLGLTIVSMVPHFGILLVWVLLGFLVSGYVGAGPDRVSYVGIQITASMLTVLGIAAIPVESYFTAEERTIGAIFGFFIAFAVAHFFWPEHPATLLRANIARNLRLVPDILSEMCRTDGADPGRLSQMVSQFKVQVQADYNLLYDFSYMLSRRVRPDYDYWTMTQAMGFLFDQVGSLSWTLGDIDDDNERRALVAPLVRARGEFSTLLDDLADRIERGETGSDPAIAAVLRALEGGSAPSDAAGTTGANDPERWRARFGRNAVREIVYQCSRIYASLDADRQQTKVSATALAHSYEGSR